MKRHRSGDAGRSRPRAHNDLTNVTLSNGRESTGDFAADDFFRRSKDKKADQKARQLCRQVYRTLNVALPGCGDEAIQNLTVVSVDPAPDAGHLLVTVQLGSGAALATEGRDVLARLANATGRLRAEVARDIVRKRAPELSFRVMPRGEVAE